jgi:hypothetical protein
MHDQFYFKKQWKLFKEQSDTMLGKPKTVGDKVWNAWQVTNPIFDELKNADKMWQNNFDAEGNKLPTPLRTDMLARIESVWNDINKYLHNNTDPNMTKVQHYRDTLIDMMSKYARVIQNNLGKNKKLDFVINNYIKSLKPTFLHLNF